MKRIAAVMLLCGTATASQAQPAAVGPCKAALEYAQAHDGLSLLVLKDGKPLCSSTDTSTPRELWSGTKSLVGLMAAAAVQDGLLSLDERAADTLTEWQGDPQKGAITIRQLLSMTSGHASTVGRPQGYLESTKAALTAAPGSKFQYGPAPMQIMGEIMQHKLSTARLDANPRSYIERRILNPIGVKIGGWRNGPDGAALLPQGISLSADEWAKIGELVRHGGMHQGKPLVDPQAFAAMFKGSAANPAYGLTWWLPRATKSNDPVTRTTDITVNANKLPADLVVAAGAGDQRLYVIPSQKLVIVRQARMNMIALATGRVSGWSDTHFLSLIPKDAAK